MSYTPDPSVLQRDADDGFESAPVVSRRFAPGGGSATVSSAPSSAATRVMSPDALTEAVYDRIEQRLRTEILHDLERKGLLVDPR
jgi:hypothetical protein